MKEKELKIIAFMPTKDYTFDNVEDCIKEVRTFIGTRAAKVVDGSFCAITVTCELNETDIAEINKICEKNDCGALFLYAKDEDAVKPQYDNIIFATLTQDKTRW